MSKQAHSSTACLGVEFSAESYVGLSAWLACVLTASGHCAPHLQAVLKASWYTALLATITGYTTNSRNSAQPVRFGPKSAKLAFATAYVTSPTGFNARPISSHTPSVIQVTSYLVLPEAAIALLTTIQLRERQLSF